MSADWIELKYRLSEKQMENVLGFSKRRMDIVKMILEVSRVILSLQFEEDKESPNLVVVQGKRFRRIFAIRRGVSKEDIKSIISVFYPFRIVSSKGAIELYLGKHRISNKVISFLSSLFNRKTAMSPMVFEEIFYLFGEIKEDILLSYEEEETCWCCIEELLSFEAGYLRYDNDPRNAVKKVHPENHIDIFYEDNASLKVGLEGKIGIDDLIEIADRNTPCYFLKRV